MGLSTVLLIDDEEQVLESSRLALLTQGVKDVTTCSDPRRVVDILKENPIQVIVVDIMMPHLTGKDLLPKVLEQDPDIAVIMMTALGDLDNVVECMRRGAFDYLVKPVENFRLVTSVLRAKEFREVRRENATLKDHLLSGDLEHPEAFEEILTESGLMNQIFRYIESIAGTSRAVLITGETGTGKELIAKTVHQLSGRQGELVTVNVAGLDDTLFSDALFGHRKGAFTGADQHREGLLEQAQGGTIFLDEIGDLSLPSQVKLLRLLQEREYYPLGSDAKKRTDARFVVATSRDVRELIQKGEFRKDLYYRLQAHQIHLPPLRERPEDLKVLFRHFLRSASADLGKKEPALERRLLSTLAQYDFPGNIRELEAMIFNALTQWNQEGELGLESFLRDIELSSGECLEPRETLPQNQGVLGTIDDCVENLIDRTLTHFDNNQSAAARSLGISRQGLIARLKRRKQD